MADNAKEVVQKIQRVNGRGKASADRGRAESVSALDSLGEVFGNSASNERGHINGDDALGNYSTRKTEYSYSMKDVSAHSNRAFRYKDGNKSAVSSDVEQGINPNIDKDPDGNVYADTKYKSISLSGVETAGKAAPSFSQLVSVDPQGTSVDALQGTINNPNVTAEIKPENLFINGKPEVEDVAQGNIGDCYFLAAVLHIIQRDPQKLVNMMSVSGNQVTTKFFYRTGLIMHDWKEVSITTRIGELERTSRNKKTGETKKEVMGGSYRLEYEPSTSKWVANFETAQDLSILKITRKDLYQAALWATSLEQAFEVFGQKYGKEGKGAGWGKSELIDGIEGGFEQKMFGIFYGNDAGKTDTVKTTETTGNTILEKNKSVIKCLWKYQRSKSGDYDKDVFMSGYNNDSESFRRYDYYKGLLEKALKSSSESDASSALSDIATISEKIKSYKKDKIDDDAVRNAVNPLTQQLYNYESVKAVSDDVLHPFQNAVANVLEDSGKNLYIYSSHAYNISNVKLADSSGNVLNDSDFNKVFEKLDANQSSVTMQNPWGSTTANIAGNAQKNGQGDKGPGSGTFTTPLGEYLASVHEVSYAEIDH